MYGMLEYRRTYSLAAVKAAKEPDQWEVSCVVALTALAATTTSRGFGWQELEDVRALFEAGARQE